MSCCIDQLGISFPIFESVILHDGAVIIREGRLVAASCVMPLSAAFLADRELGLRHRAAIGITEDADAIAVVVSEERGAISLTHSGRIIRDIDTKRLESILRAFLIPRRRRWTPLNRENKTESSQRETEKGVVL